MGAQASSSPEPEPAQDAPTSGARIAPIDMKNGDMAGVTDYKRWAGSSHEGPSQDVRSQSGRFQVFVGTFGQVQSQAVPAVHGIAERLRSLVFQQAVHAHPRVLRNRYRASRRTGHQHGAQRSPAGPWGNDRRHGARAQSLRAR